MHKEVSAGGVVYRKREGRLEIQIIRDRFGRTTLAKGKLEPGETIEQAALREIAEETGIAGAIVAPLESIAYEYEHDKFGRVLKEVHYYLVEADGGALQAQLEEIAGVDWHEPAEAWRLQRESGYDNNDAVLKKALEKLGARAD
ncbi:NUDIX hydrolase [Paenibacillaceae bacterium WGS1546]|uniref:NUDIX hydrolase n=1 Tax=Cohnella sp. WGS1546 TaxID=3366810 RepID=UPI00372D0293